MKLFREVMDDFHKLLELEPLNPMNQLTLIMDIEKYADIPKGENMETFRSSLCQHSIHHQITYLYIYL